MSSNTVLKLIQLELCPFFGAIVFKGTKYLWLSIRFASYFYDHRLLGKGRVVSNLTIACGKRFDVLDATDTTL
jgi:hypothetical protein